MLMKHQTVGPDIDCRFYDCGRVLRCRPSSSMAALSVFTRNFTRLGILLSHPGCDDASSRHLYYHATSRATGTIPGLEMGLVFRSHWRNVCSGIFSPL